jgi:hypothetical protein
MPFSEKEILEDLHKVRVRKYVYILGGLGILGLSVVLVVLFFAKRDWPALLLAGVGIFWSVILFYHAHRTRQLEGLITTRLEGRRGEAAADDIREDAAGADDSVTGEPGRDAGGAAAPEGGAPGEP